VWLLLRERLLSAHQHDNSFKTIHVPLVPTVLLDILLVVVLFVRIVFLNKPFDILTVLGVFDICVCSLYIFILVGHFVVCNEIAFSQHLGVLEQVRFKTVRQLAQCKSRRKLQELKSTNLLLESSIENLKNMTAPLTVFGLVVDQALVLQFGSLAAAGAVTGLTKIVGVA